MEDPSLDKQKHVAFLQLMLESLPAEYETQEINTLTLAYFAISALALLDALDRVKTPPQPPSPPPQTNKTQSRNPNY